MPEYPDVVVYIESLQRRIVDSTLDEIKLLHPFFLRSVTPSPEELCDRRVQGVERLGKRIVIALEPSFFIVIHLMIAGRLAWSDQEAPIPRKIGLAAFRFSGETPGTLLVTEAGTKRRASLHLAEGRASLDAFKRGGLEIDGTTLEEFSARLRLENHTLKRALTDPRLFSGIGNAYSDEILHRARLSPFKQSRSLSDEETARLLDSCRAVLTEWVDRLRRETGDGFPKKVTAFRAEMSVHGKYGKPCPACGTPVQRISYADNECNYCPECQTGGKLLADRSLSRLLKGDWPATLAELEELRAPAGIPGPIGNTIDAHGTD